MLQTLEGDGLIKRLPDRSDGRLTENRITAKGQRVVREIQAITDELRQELLGMLDTTEILHAARLLSVVNARLDGRGSHGAETPRGENHTID
jgi:DNA-binding MarR family transcriptional regulator